MYAECTIHSNFYVRQCLSTTSDDNHSFLRQKLIFNFDVTISREMKREAAFFKKKIKFSCKDYFFYSVHKLFLPDCFLSKHFGIVINVLFLQRDIFN